MVYAFSCVLIVFAVIFIWFVFWPVTHKISIAIHKATFTDSASKKSFTDSLSALKKSAITLTDMRDEMSVECVRAMGAAWDVKPVDLLDSTRLYFSMLADDVAHSSIVYRELLETMISRLENYQQYNEQQLISMAFGLTSCLKSARVGVTDSSQLDRIEDLKVSPFLPTKARQYLGLAENLGQMRKKKNYQ